MIVQSLETLRIKSQPFTGSKEDLEAIIASLEFELKEGSHFGVGLSAIQIGVPERVSIIRINHKIKQGGVKREIKESYNLYNAEIIKKLNPFVFKGEGCLSVPDKICDTNRYNEIIVKNGNGKEYEFSGFVAVVVQHELDHVEGIIFTDRETKE